MVMWELVILLAKCFVCYLRCSDNKKNPRNKQRAQHEFRKLIAYDIFGLKIGNATTINKPLMKSLLKTRIPFEAYLISLKTKDKKRNIYHGQFISTT